MKDLPKIFYSAKKEFTKQFNFAVSRAKNDNKEIELENYAVIFALIQEFNNFLASYEEEIAIGTKDRMDELKKYKVFLSDYEKTLRYDNDASWLFLSDFTSKDKEELTKIQNEEFLRKRNEKLVLNGEI